MKDPKEAEPPALAEGETGLHVDTDTPGHTAVSSVRDILSPVIESKFLYRSLQFSDLTLIERINSSEHHRLGGLYGDQGLHWPVFGVECVAYLGLSGGLHVGDQVPHLAWVQILTRLGGRG